MKNYVCNIYVENSLILMQLCNVILWGFVCLWFLMSKQDEFICISLSVFLFFQTSHYNVYLIAILSFLPPRFRSLSQWISGSKVVIASVLYLFIFFSKFCFHSLLITFRTCNFYTKLLASSDIWFKPAFPGHYKYLLFCSSAKDYIWVWSIFRKQTIDYLAHRVSKENCRC